mgnify:FL=1
MALDYHSYFSVFTKTASTAGTGEKNIFDEDNHSSYDFDQVGSPDISYDASTGAITFHGEGDYFLVFAANCGVGADDKTATLRIKQNGTNIIENEPILLEDDFEPEQCVVHMIATIEAGDIITCTHQGSDATSFTALGCYFTALKTKGHYSSAVYTTKADVQDTLDNYSLYRTSGDGNEGGVVASKVNGVVYNTANGRFSPSATRKFLYFSTWIFEGDENTIFDLQHKLTVDGSALDDLTAGCSVARSPLCHTYSLIAEVADDEYATVNRDQSSVVAREFELEEGTSFSFIDISNNGADPKAFFCLSETNDSDALSTSSGDKSIFDEDNYGTHATTQHVTATGITYTAGDGTLTVAHAGDYLVTCVLGSNRTGSGTANSLNDFKITVNGSTYFIHEAWKDSTQDVQSNVICLILRLKVGDVVGFVVNNYGAKVDDGTSVSMFMVNDVGGSKDLFPQKLSDELVGDDYVIKNYSPETTGRQHDHLATAVPQFSLGVPGALNLRRRGDLAEPYTTNTGKSKK